MSVERPIGVFDSGIGGLTVARAIQAILPYEQLIYFGDTAHLPYGDKSAEAIKYYALKIAKFLIKQGCKAIVIACNTASALAHQHLCEVIGSKQVPVYNVIDPVVEYITDRAYPYQRIGVIATVATIQSDVYAQKIHKRISNIQVQSLATPLLIPMIEDGFFNESISKIIIHTYLSSPQLANINSLILGCTHFPIIYDQIAEFYRDPIEIVNGSTISANFVQSSLDQQGLLNHSKGKPVNLIVYVSDYTRSFEQSTRIFFKGDIRLMKKNLWA